MSDLLSHSDATPSEREASTDFTPNPDMTRYLSEITATQFSSSDTLDEQLGGIQKTLSVAVTVEKGHVCGHEDQSYGLGFKISSPRSKFFQIQVYDRSFDIERDALGASWAGRWMLLQHGYWIQLLKTLFTHRQGAVFRVEAEEQGWHIIRGSCCSHATKVHKTELEECWVGRLVLAESYEGWRWLVKGCLARLFFGAKGTKGF